MLGHAHQDGFLADELDGQVGIVAGQGIGLATVTAFLGAGMNVVGGDLVVDHIDELAASSDGRVVALDVDLATPDGPARLVDEAVERYGAVDVLVNNAAVIGGEVPFVELTDEQWQSSLTINLLAAVRASRAAVPVMTAAGRGVILTVGSDAGELSHPGFARYAVSKAALMNLNKLLSKEFGRQGVRANLVAVGLTMTHATEGLVASLVEEHGGRTEGISHFADDLGMALARFGAADGVASLLLYLAGDLAAQVTGAVIRMDGGAVPTV